MKTLLIILVVALAMVAETAKNSFSDQDTDYTLKLGSENCKVLQEARASGNNGFPVVILHNVNAYMNINDRSSNASDSSWKEQENKFGLHSGDIRGSLSAPSINVHVTGFDFPSALNKTQWQQALNQTPCEGLLSLEMCKLKGEAHFQPQVAVLKADLEHCQSAAKVAAQIASQDVNKLSADLKDAQAFLQNERISMAKCSQDLQNLNKKYEIDRASDLEELKVYSRKVRDIEDKLAEYEYSYRVSMNFNIGQFCVLVGLVGVIIGLVIVYRAQKDKIRELKRQRFIQQ